MGASARGRDRRRDQAVARLGTGTGTQRHVDGQKGAASTSPRLAACLHAIRRRRADGLLLPASPIAWRDARPLRGPLVQASSAGSVRQGLEAIRRRRQGVHADTYQQSGLACEGLAPSYISTTVPLASLRRCSSSWRLATRLSTTRHKGHCRPARRIPSSPWPRVRSFRVLSPRCWRLPGRCRRAKDRRSR
jgi:hypothetical protein